MKTQLLLISFFLISISYNISFAQTTTWEYGATVVGSPGFADGYVEYTDIVMDGNTPYVVFVDINDDEKAKVMKYTASMNRGWELVAGGAVSNSYISYTSIDLYGSIPYVAYREIPLSNEASVMYLDGGAWQTKGTLGFSPGEVKYIKIAMDGSIPYVVFQDRNESDKAVTCMKYTGNGASGWEVVGVAGFSNSQAEYTDIKIYDGTPYVVFSDYDQGSKVSVMKFNGSNWESVGSLGFSTYSAAYTKIDVVGGIPYVVFKENNKISVMKFTGGAGGSWVYVGSQGFSSGSVNRADLVLYGNIPYVAFVDLANSNKATVMKYPDDLSGWEVVGTAGFSEGAIQYPGIALYNETPYVVYDDGGYSSKTTVMTFSDSWSNGVPNSSTSATINCDLTLSENLITNNLTIQSGVQLIIDTQISTTVNGNFINNAGVSGLIINSDATGTGSLITNGSVSGSITIGRYIPKYTGSSGWHFLSSPIGSQTIRPEFVSSTNPIPGNDDFYSWDEPTNYWINTKGDDGNWNSEFEDNFIIGRGYMVSYENNVTKTYTEIPNSGDYIFNNSTSPALTYTADQGEGWNLMGNPYPSAIDWDELTKTNIDASVYVYDGDAGQYISWNGSVGSLTDGIIPQMNGFFTKVESNAILTIPNSSRLHTLINFHKTINTVNDLLVLQVDGNGYNDKTYIHFNEEATKNFDAEYDAWKLFGKDEAPQIYSHNDDQKFSINELTFSEDLVIPISLKVGATGVYTISIAEGTISDQPKLLFKDKKENLTIDLKLQPSYSFVSEIDDDPDRFLVYFNEASAVDEIDLLDKTKIYTEDESVIIDNTYQGTINVTIYNMMGQQLTSRTLNSVGLHRISLSGYNSSFYIVTIDSESFTKTEKLFIY